MCTKSNRVLVKTEYLLLIFAAVFLSNGLCQNAEPRGSSVSDEIRQKKTEHPANHYDSANTDQEFDPSRWDGSRKIGKSLNEDVTEMVSSPTDTGNFEVQTEAAVIHNTVLDENDKAATGLENRHHVPIRKTSRTTVFGRRSFRRGSRRRLCANEPRYKKRRRYTNLRRTSAIDKPDFSPSNRIRGSSARSRRIQERGQIKSNNEGRKCNGKSTRKQESVYKARSRKNNHVASRISRKALTSLHEATSETVRSNKKKNTKEFVSNQTSSNVTVERIEQMVKNDLKLTKVSRKGSEIIKNIDGYYTTAVEAILTPKDSKERRQESVSNEFWETQNKPEIIRRRHEENVEHEFSRNLEKEILWSRTEFPEVMDETPSPTNEKTDSSSTTFGPDVSTSDLPNTFTSIQNSRYDAAKMLGYSRSAEDMPIMDLENEVLARTLDDYNAYLKKGGEMSNLSRHSTNTDVNPREGIRDDESLSARHPVYNHEISKTDDHQLEISEGLVNTEINSSLKGDLTCINGTFIPAPLARNSLIKYVKSSIPGHEYLEANYECTPGFYMASSNDRLLCKNRRWIGALPNCKIRQGQLGLCAESTCDHVCSEVDGQAKCSCYKGFRLDGHKCYDINECESNNGGCHYKCVNIPSSYRCECPQGMERGENKFTCIDVNECLLNNGHGPCQDTCHNREGSYTCSCEGLTDTILSSDNHMCQDAGPCTVNNAGCSHTCLSTMGRVFCLCPDGFMLADDWKTCQDVDECYVPDLQAEICRYGCINTPGSYRCIDPTELSAQPIQDSLSITCFPGYELTTESNCIDINECAVNNGGCSEVCENTEGSFFCACDGDEKALSANGKSCTDIGNLACAPLDPAGRGFLICSREATPRMWRNVKREAIRPGTKCYLKCPVGYQLHGEYQLTCQADGTWDGPKHGECVKYSKPRLECPKDVVAEIPPDRDEAFVTFDQPSTDLDWFRYVRSKPSWGTRLEASLKRGLHLVTFFARHPVSKKQASCVLRIIVKEGEAPKVDNCPSDIAGKNGTSFTWTEPIFSDNVSVTHTSNNESPGKSFGIGEWKIVYEASDEAGWTTRCVFSVVVHQD